MTEPVKTLLEAMAAGVAKQTALLSAVIPRVSPEYAVVAAATEGLLRLGGDRRVVLERVHKETPIKGKCDLAVEWASQRHYFEFKCLWPGGLKENLRGISADLKKLEPIHPLGFAVVFCYAIEKAPAGCGAWEAKGRTVDATLEEAREKFGPTIFESSLMTLGDYGVSGSAKLVAWQAATIAAA